MIRDEIIYSNNFENKESNNLDGAAFIEFNKSTVVGNYNNDGFSVHLEDIGEHQYIHLSFDLYIHGSWDGNSNGFLENDKADKWIIELNPEMNLFQDPQIKFITTFSNSPCWPNYCLKQSYPDDFPTINNPKNGMYNDNLKEVCNNNFFGGSTTHYKIEKIFPNSGNALIVRFYDELYQPNAIDKYGVNQQKCDESWSLDNLVIRAINYK